METIVQKLQAAQKLAMENRPKIGGFPYLAETLRQAGVRRNVWTLPACQSVYYLEEGVVVQQGTPLTEGTAIIPLFNEAALITVLRRDQAGDSTFMEFLQGAWEAGVIWYEVDFEKRTVMYGGAQRETYTESYQEVKT